MLYNALYHIIYSSCFMSAIVYHSRKIKISFSGFIIFCFEDITVLFLRDSFKELFLYPKEVSFSSVYTYLFHYSSFLHNQVIPKYHFLFKNKELRGLL